MKYACLALTISCLFSTGYLARATQEASQEATQQPNKGKATKAPPIQHSTTEHSDFMPESFERAKLVACYIGGNADQTADSLVLVQYTEGIKEFRALIGKNNNALAGLQDCVNWFQHAKEHMAQDAKHEKRNRDGNKDSNNFVRPTVQ